MAAPTLIAAQAMKGPFDAVSAGDLTITFTAGTITDGNVYAVTGREILLYKNGTGTNTITIESEDDANGRQEDITTYSLATGAEGYFCGGLTNAAGWKNSAGQIRVTVSSAEISLAILRLPVGYP